MSKLSWIGDQVRKAGYFSYLYPNSDDRFSSLLPNRRRLLCCHRKAVCNGQLEPIGLALIVYQGDLFSVVYTMGGMSYLCPTGVDLLDLIQNTLLVSPEEPTSIIPSSVVAKYQLQNLDVVSVFSHTALDEFEEAMVEPLPFSSSELFADMRRTPVSLIIEASGFVHLQHGKAKAIAFVQDLEQLVPRVQLAVLGNLRECVDSLYMVRYLLRLRRWSIFHEAWGVQIGLSDPFYQFPCSVEAPEYWLKDG